MSGNIRDDITTMLKEKYPDIDLRSVEIDEVRGTSTLYVGNSPQMDKTVASLSSRGIVSPNMHKSTASTIYRDALDRSVLDLLVKDNAYRLDPVEAYKKAIEYYYIDPVIGSSVNLLSNLATRGFENDIDDDNIKNFFDVWCFDIGISELLEYMFLDFFKVGVVHTYKVIANYEPRISYLSPVPGKSMKKSKSSALRKETAAPKGTIPVSYTILNPLLVKIDGNLLFNKFSIKLSPPPELTELLKKPTKELTTEEKELIKILPKDIKAAAESGTEILLPSESVSSITYRKQPYERYARPRISRVFDALDYKKALQEADISTLDGITNYILKITVGNDEYPVTSESELEAVAQLFNTPSKSFEVVWNHTLSVEKIVSPEIENVLGKDKYEQVNQDLMLGLSIPRALLDGEGNTATLEFAVKGVLEEINYARRQVENWIYKEYRQIAEAVGFDRFPKVRWDEGILRDTILYMNIISQMVDRRMLSYNTALESLGFDFKNERNNMENELDMVKSGTFGLHGSPWQATTKTGTDGTKPVGTPPSGRPTGTPTGDKDVRVNQTDKVSDKIKYETKKSASLSSLVKELSDEDFVLLIKEMSDLRAKSK